MIPRRFEEYGFPLCLDDRIIPGDNSTLFVCSGMQPVRHRFTSPDGSVHGSLQSCVRTNDLGLVGDGTHLTSFGTFGPQPWDEWVEGERRLREQSLKRGRKLWRRHRDKPPQWWETCGLTEEDMNLLE